jgi:ribose transport system permease protein
VIILGLRYSGFGRLIYAVGDNVMACRLAGVRTWQVLLAVYALCGALSAAAGILLVGFNDAADLGIATPFLLPSVAAVVIGGTSIFGGVGGYAGTILGALILTVILVCALIPDILFGHPFNPVTAAAAAAAHTGH